MLIRKLVVTVSQLVIVSGIRVLHVICCLLVKKKRDLKWLTGQFSIVGLALVKLQLGYVEHYPVRIQHRTPPNKKRATLRVISFKTNYKKWLINMGEIDQLNDLKSLDREKPFSLAFALFSRLSRHAPSANRVVLRVYRAFCSTDQGKTESECCKSFCWQAHEHFNLK